MFELGYFYLVSLFGFDQQDINIYICYEVWQNVEFGVYVYFDMDGEIDGKLFSDFFELLCDIVFNFVSDVMWVVQKYGLYLKFGVIIWVYKEYDVMFEDICVKLYVYFGELVDFEWIICYE